MFSLYFAACGWILTGLAVSVVPLWGLHGLYSRKADTFKEVNTMSPLFYNPQYGKVRTYKMI